MGDIPDGMYSPLGIELFSQDDFKTVVSSLLEIREKIRSGASVETIQKEVREAIAANGRFASYLKKFTPKSIQDVQSLLTVIGILCGAYAYYTSGGADRSIAIPEVGTELIGGMQDHRTPEVPLATKQHQAGDPSRNPKLSGGSQQSEPDSQKQIE